MRELMIDPEVRLVSEFCTWFGPQMFGGDANGIRVGLQRFMTEDIVLHEATSLPWGGEHAGYDGWLHMVDIARDIYGPILSLLDVSSPDYYPNGNVVFVQFTMTIKSSPEASEPFVMKIVEKHTIENARIGRIDVFYADTAGLLERLSVLGRWKLR